MNQWISKKTFSVLDFGAETARVLVLKKNTRGTLEVLGAGESPSHGILNGQCVQVGDAVESVVEAMKRASSVAGREGGALYYNLDGAEAESLFPRGSKNLSGEGQIRPQDMRQVKDNAERIINRFEKTVVYSSELKFLIDGKDAVLNPLGTFGRSLDVFMHVVTLRSEHADLWLKVMTRAGIRRAVPVFSSWSTARGVIGADAGNKRRLIFDLGRDLTNVFVHHNGRITDHRAFLSGNTEKESLENAATAGGDLFSRHADIEEALATGDRVQDAGFLEGLSILMPFPVKAAPLPALPGCERPEKASLAGLAFLAADMERQKAVPSLEKDLLLSIKEKAVSFFEAYF